MNTEERIPVIRSKGSWSSGQKKPCAAFHRNAKDLVLKGFLDEDCPPFPFTLEKE